MSVSRFLGFYELVVDLVFVDYLDHVVVVCDDVCCCCVHAFNGDILVFRKLLIVCGCV